MAEVAEKLSSEAMAFSAETSRVLKLMIHSLYTNKDIFLRELISNASDACDKLRYDAITKPELLEGAADLKISIAYDKKKHTLTITDTGVGMNRADLIANLGTIAKSGTLEYLQGMAESGSKDVNLIGQFGVGFYSAFMVADKVSVHTRKAGEAEAWRWESDGEGTFTVDPAETRARGTEITLHLKKDAKEYLDAYKLKFIAQTYSDHIAFPIEITNDEGNAEVANKASAIWMRPKSDITKEQYQEFYRAIAHSPDEPWMVLHNKAEGKIEYTNLLFIPSLKPFDLFHPERRSRVKLYVKRVYITDEGVELVPAYLRFMRGVIDSEDLPLNISRETLQKNPTLDKIRESVVKRVLGDLKNKAEKDAESYQKFWENFGAVLKEGLCEANSPREKILEACRFHSTHADEMTSVDAYISRMKEGQEAIYFITGDNLNALRNSPQIEGFKKRGIEVLLLTDHVDDFWVNVTHSYKEKPFRAVIRAGADLEKYPLDGEAKEEPKADESHVSKLITEMRALFGDEVRDVRTTAKLSESPVCLAIGEGDMDPRMERFLVEHKQLPKRMARILEINPSHPVIKRLSAQADAGALNDHARDVLWLLLDQAKIQEGETIADPVAFARRLNMCLANGL